MQVFDVFGMFLWLLLIFQIKHFFADYPLQFGWMLGKFKRNGWFLPLLVHTAVHGWFTFVISWAFTDVHFASVLAGFDMLVHFIMDRIKASPNLLGRFHGLSSREYPTASYKEKVHNTIFWWSVGFDQMVHHVTHYCIIAMIVMYNVQIQQGILV